MSENSSPTPPPPPSPAGAQAYTAPLNAPTEPPAPAEYAPHAPAGAQETVASRNVVATVALAVAALGFLFAVIPGAFILGWILLPIAFVLAIVSLCLKGKKKTLGIVALILSIVGTIVGVIVFFVTAANAFTEAFDDDVVAAPTQEAAANDEPDPASTASAQEDPAPAAAEELAVVETAFGRQDYDQTSWWYVAVLENPNADHVFPSSPLTIEAIGSDGTILDSATSYTTILAGRIAVAGTFFDVGQAEIASLEVRGPGATAAISSPAAETGAFTLESLSAVNDGYSTSVSGTISGTFETEQELITVVVIARNPDGAVLGAEQTYVDRLPAGGGKVQFEVTFLNPLPEGTKYEAYATF
ncbi:hypothetical protein B5M43_003260 [Microbacterium sp. MEC084]|uniref:hypothetical protein n=1 Tax=Microbacterium sp. MEC084 TaxID=1963027 RepID=UPI00106FBD74|nr:hypothetical protein [Microbacterium sp. MEC084]MCD1267867.1 hypothetical protein [Microbacterium sp. MEC084]